MRESRLIVAMAKMRLSAVTLISLALSGCTAIQPQAPSNSPYITSASPIRLVSANDGDAMQYLGLPNSDLADSVTVIDLGPDGPPVVRTVSGKVPSTYNGAPYGAVLMGGRYALIPSNSWASRFGGQPEPDQVSVVDLDDPGLAVTSVVDLPTTGWQVAAHPDGERAIAISDHQFHMIAMTPSGAQIVAQSEPFPLFFISFALSPDGRTIVVTAADELALSMSVELHVFAVEGNSIAHRNRIDIAPGIGSIDQPFAPRFSPDGSRVLVLNGLGIASRPPLDSILSIDMTAELALVTQAIPNVAQGLESLAFHPSGRFAVVTCIDGPTVSHLAVVDLTISPMRVLSYQPMPFVPQGIEFSPDGSQLFVQAASAHHIAVYDIEGMILQKSPFVLHTGEGPGSLSITAR